jgi:hypothetical protein
MHWMVHGEGFLVEAPRTGRSMRGGFHGAFMLQERLTG